MCALTQPEPVHLPKNGVCGPVAADKNAVVGLIYRTDMIVGTGKQLLLKPARPSVLDTMPALLIREMVSM